MSHTPPKSYREADGLLRLKEIRDEISLEEVKFESLQRDNDAYEDNLNSKKLKNNILLAEEEEYFTVLQEKYKVLEEEVEKHDDILDEKIELLARATATVEEKRKELELIEDGISENRGVLDKGEEDYKKRVKQIEEDITKKTKIAKSIQIESKDLQKLDITLQRKQIELDKQDTFLVGKERTLEIKEKVLNKYAVRLKVKYPKEEFK